MRSERDRKEVRVEDKRKYSSTHSALWRQVVFFLF